MQNIITKSVVKIIGIDWSYFLIASEHDISDVDMLRGQDGSLTRETIENYMLQELSCDFMFIYDIYADLYIDPKYGDKIIPWDNSKSYAVFTQLLYPEDLSDQKDDSVNSEHF